MAHGAYISRAFYDSTYYGRSIDAEQFDRIALRASEEIDSLTNNQIRIAGGLATFSDADQERIRLATCVVAERINLEDDLPEGASSEKVGSYSYTIDPAMLANEGRKARVRAESFLQLTGLLYRGLV